MGKRGRTMDVQVVRRVHESGVSEKCAMKILDIEKNENKTKRIAFTRVSLSPILQ